MKDRFRLKHLLVSILLKNIKGTIIYCDNCGSPQTKYYDVDKQENKDTIIVRYEIKCLNCGAHGLVREVWDVNKI